MTEVYGKLGDLLKYASYYLGTVSSRNMSETLPAELAAQHEFDWFEPFYNDLAAVHTKLWEQFGAWDNHNTFELIGDILEKMAASIGVEARRLLNAEIWFDIPFRVESMPDGG